MPNVRADRPKLHTAGNAKWDSLPRGEPFIGEIWFISNYF